MARDCPAADELARFAVGDVPAARLKALADHVQQCDACQTALDEFDACNEAADPLLSGLRETGSCSAAVAEPVSSKLLAVARNARSAAASGIVETADGRRRLGKFELLEELGCGSFGHVFRAHDAELDRIVAIKILRAGGMADVQDVERLLREARSAAQLKHPGIVSLYDIGQTADGAHYLVEEFIEGATLAARLVVGRFDPRHSAEFVAETADALEYAHRHGVVHRDVKPSNIMIDSAGRPHLMDFGLAKREGDDTAMTLEGQVLGTPAYMSPEQARGESHAVDARSDVYSLGVVLYELLTGERPFRGNRRMLLLHLLEDEPRPPRQLNDRVPRDLETICLKALAKSPHRRYAAAAEFAADLRRWLRGEAILARPVGPAERAWRWCRRNPAPSGVFAAVVLGSVFGFWLLSRLSEQLVRSTALDSVEQQAAMLEEVDKMYSSEVVDRLQPLKIHVTHNYRDIPSAIPLPATLNIELGERISDLSATGMKVRLYSDHPIQSRTDGGVRDQFEADALARLRAGPCETFHRFEKLDGRDVLRFAKARRMGETCLKCHNQPEFKASTNRVVDWQVDEVGGVMEITRPLDQDIARTRAGLRGTFVLVASVSGSLIGLTGLWVWRRSRRRETS